MPKTGVFGLIDLVGLDLMPHINASLARRCRKSDAFHADNRDAAADQEDDRRGLYRPQGQGRLLPHQSRRRRQVKEAIDLATGDYRAERQARAAEVAGRRARICARCSRTPARSAAMPGACWARRSPMPPRSCPKPPTTSIAVDEAMRLGYNWKFGPFELIDQLGAGLARRRAGGRRRPRGAAAAAARPRAAASTASRTAARQYLGADGAYHDLVRARGRADARGHQARRASRC